MAFNEFLNLYKELKSTEFGSWFQQLINLSLKNKERAELLLKRLYNLKGWPLVRDVANSKNSSRLTRTRPKMIL